MPRSSPGGSWAQVELTDALTRGLAACLQCHLTYLFSIFFTFKNTDQAGHIILSCNNWAEGSFWGRGFVLEMSLISTFLNIKPLHCAVGSPMNPLYGGLVRDSY